LKLHILSQYEPIDKDKTFLDDYSNSNATTQILPNRSAFDIFEPQ